MALGLLGVVVFAMTLPMTRLAVGDRAAPQLDPAFVTAGRAAGAGLLSAAWLAWHRVAPPPRAHWRALALSALGTVLGFPLFLALALREVDAMHAAVITGVLPLGTAVAAALAFRQRPSPGFWLCALAGCMLVLAFAAWQGGGALSLGDGWLLLAVLSTSVGYVAGARVSHALPASQVICWILVGSLPVTLPLALGGTVRVSQVQLIQPVLALLFAVPVLGERLDAPTLVFSLAVIAVVFIGRKMPVATR